MKIQGLKVSGTSTERSAINSTTNTIANNSVFYETDSGNIYSWVSSVWIPKGEASKASQDIAIIGDRPRRIANINKSRKALIAAPARAISGTATAGIIYQTVAKDLIYCTTTGTTGVPDPTISFIGPVTDGTAAFYFIGRKSDIATDQDVPAITVSTSIGTLTERRLTVSPDLKFNVPNGTIIDYSSVAVKNVAWNDGTAVDNGFGANGNVGSNAYFEFTSDAPLLSISLWNSAGIRIFIDVDDHPIEESVTPYIAGNPCYYEINWGGIRKSRKYTVKGTGNIAFRGICALPTDIVSATSVTNKTALLWFGDSYANTETPTVSLGAISSHVHGLAYMVGEKIGVDYVIAANVGGSGYARLGTSSRPAVQTVVANTDFSLARNDGGIVVYAAGINEIADTVATVVAAALASWTAGMVKYPHATHIVIGVWVGQSGPGATTLTLDTALALAAASLGINYISIAQDTLGTWISGTGKVGATNGTGNSNHYTSTDGTHPSPIGKKYLADRISANINAYLDTINI